jgi:hypothetical protein
MAGGGKHRVPSARLVSLYFTTTDSPSRYVFFTGTISSLSAGGFFGGTGEEVCAVSNVVVVRTIAGIKSSLLNVIKAHEVPGINLRSTASHWPRRA